ncbi:MAG: helix-turn-helix domain-containing protein [Prevotellaceae bacterium]|nr:helix-turn-helix domain-containing protein [Prevotellaceae bacterium]
MEQIREHIIFPEWLENNERAAIDDEIAIYEYPTICDTERSHVVSGDTIILCESGTIDMLVNMERVVARSQYIVILLDDYIVKFNSVSDDMRCRVLINTRQLFENILADVNERLHIAMSIYKTPCKRLNEPMFRSMTDHIIMLKRIMSIEENPDRINIIRHMMIAYYYGIRSCLYPDISRKLSHKELVVERFIELVKKHHMQERMLSFYADRLCITTKYMSKLIKETTGKSPNDWIDEYVMVRAKYMLKSTDLSIQQISIELHFQNASFFAKYFRRHAGMSPKEYRKNRI